MSAFVCQHTPLTESLCECWSLISKLSDQCIAIMVRALITDQHPSQEKRILYTHTHTLATFGRNVFCWDNFQNNEVCNQEWSQTILIWSSDGENVYLALIFRAWVVPSAGAGRLYWSWTTFWLQSFRWMMICDTCIVYTWHWLIW